MTLKGLEAARLWASKQIDQKTTAGVNIYIYQLVRIKHKHKNKSVRTDGGQIISQLLFCGKSLPH